MVSWCQCHGISPTENGDGFVGKYNYVHLCSILECEWDITGMGYIAVGNIPYINYIYIYIYIYMVIQWEYTGT